MSVLQRCRTKRMKKGNIKGSTLHVGGHFVEIQ